MVLMAIELHSSRAFSDSYRRTSHSTSGTTRLAHSPVPCAPSVPCVTCPDEAGERGKDLPLARYLLLYRLTALPIYNI